MPLSFSLTPADKTFLGHQARTAIEAGLAGVYSSTPPAPPQGLPDDVLTRSLGAFVTLTINHGLRGCIGNIIGHEALYATVWHMAAAAAFQDPRFHPSPPRNGPKPTWKSLLLMNQPSAPPAGRAGRPPRSRAPAITVTVACSCRKCPEQGWDRAAYLENLCRKAGLPPDSWRKPGARLFWYEALVFPVPDAAA